MTSYIQLYIKEIRVRILYIVFSFLTTFLFSFYYSQEIINLLAKPLQEAYYIQQMEYFVSVFSKEKDLALNYENASTFASIPLGILREFNAVAVVEIEGLLPNESISANSRKFSEISWISGMDSFFVGCKTNSFQLKQFHFIFTDISEGFFAKLYVSLFCSFYFIIPLIFYQLWLFIKPGLYSFEKFYVLNFFFLSFFLAFFNIGITYFVLIPNTCNFFLSFQSDLVGLASSTLEGSSKPLEILVGETSSIPSIDYVNSSHVNSSHVHSSNVDSKNAYSSNANSSNVHSSNTLGMSSQNYVELLRGPESSSTSSIHSFSSRETNLLQHEMHHNSSVLIQLEARIHTYLNLVIKLILICHFFFQLPLFLLLLVYFNVFGISSVFFTKWYTRKVFYFLFLCLSGLISPPDIFSQLFLLIPLIFFYEFSVFIILYMRSKNRSLSKDFTDSPNQRKSDVLRPYIFSVGTSKP